MTHHSKLLSQFPNIIHGHTDKSSGVLRFESGERDEVIANREKLAEGNGFSLDRVVMVEQVHGNDVRGVGPSTSSGSSRVGVRGEGAVVGKYDAMITDQVGSVMVIKTADCVPLLFYASQKKVVGVVHAGWPGLAKNIIHQVVQKMRNEYNIDSSELFVSIGPSICVDHYDVSTVKDDRIVRFEANFGQNTPVIRRQNNKVALDLQLAARIQLINEGVPEEQIEDSGICTYEHPEQWPSYRRDQSDLGTPIWSFIGLK